MSQVERWAETERDLRDALAAADPGEAVTAWVVEYLDHNELGLAFATLVEALNRHDVPPPQAAIDRLEAAYLRMGRPSDGAEAWARLTRTSG